MKLSRTVLKMVVALSLSLVGAPPASAASSPVGTWVKKTESGQPGMTLIIEEWGPGKAKLTWHVPNQKIVLTLVSKLDGSPAPLLIDGNKSSETMAIKLIDKRHTTTTLQMNGKPFGSSKSEFSADYNTMTVENEKPASGTGEKAGKTTEVWIRSK